VYCPNGTGLSEFDIWHAVGMPKLVTVYSKLGVLGGKQIAVWTQERVGLSLY
jgi:hypothetical protein